MLFFFVVVFLGGGGGGFNIIEERGSFSTFLAKVSYFNSAWSFVLLLYVPSQQLRLWRDGQFT